MSLAANQSYIAWTLLASGIVFIISFVFLALMFTIKRSPWGSLNDVTYVLALIFIIPFLLSFYGGLRGEHPLFALAALLLGIGGIGLIAYTQVGLVLGMIEFSHNLRQGACGAGLLGVAFIINHLTGAGSEILPDGLNWLGLATGILMTMGIPTGLFFGQEELEMTTGKLDWKSANRMAITSVLATFIGQLFLILLVIALGFHFL